MFGPRQPVLQIDSGFREASHHLFILTNEIGERLDGIDPVDTDYRFCVGHALTTPMGIALAISPSAESKPVPSMSERGNLSPDRDGKRENRLDQIRKVYGESIASQPVTQPTDMIGIARFHHAMHGDLADVFAGKGAIVSDLLDADLFLGEQA